jgi:hypothetical protein
MANPNFKRTLPAGALCVDCGYPAKIRGQGVGADGGVCRKCYNRRWACQRKGMRHVPPPAPPLPPLTGPSAVAIYEEALREIALGATNRSGKLRRLPETVAALREVAREALKRGHEHG